MTWNFLTSSFPQKLNIIKFALLKYQACSGTDNNHNKNENNNNKNTTENLDNKPNANCNTNDNHCHYQKKKLRIWTLFKQLILNT